MCVRRSVVIQFIFMMLFSGVVTAEESLLDHGAYLVEGILACGNCHTPKNADAVPVDEMKFAGAFVIEEPEFRAYAPNITMDRETGIGAWTDAEIIRSIRDGIRPDGTIIGPPMPSFLYRDISDRDIEAVVAYLRTVPSVRNVVPKSEYHIPLPPAWGPPVVSVAEVPREDALAYGAYLAGPLGHCIECHTPRVNGMPDFSRLGAGGNVYKGIFGLDIVAVALNITAHPQQGLGAWTDDQIKAAITEGIRHDGRKLAPVMGYGYYARMTAEDLDALVLYLRSIPPQPPLE